MIPGIRLCRRAVRKLPQFNRSFGQTPSLITSDLISVRSLTEEGRVSYARRIL